MGSCRFIIYLILGVGGGEDEPIGGSIIYQIPQIFFALKHAYLIYKSPTRQEGYAGLMNEELRISHEGECGKDWV
jgi:hypothetical protein